MSRVQGQGGPDPREHFTPQAAAPHLSVPVQRRGEGIVSMDRRELHDLCHALVGPHGHADRRPFLAARGRIKAAIRAWFAGQGFTEVDTGLPAGVTRQRGPLARLQDRATKDHDLQPRTPLLAHLARVRLQEAPCGRRCEDLHVCHVFRNRERGALHAPEFTLVEWYRAKAPDEALMADAAAILKLAAETADTRFVSFRGVTAIRAPPERLTVAEAFSRYAGIDLRRPEAARGEGPRPFAAKARRAGITPPRRQVVRHLRQGADRPDRAQARQRQPTLLDRIPRERAALGNPRRTIRRLAERFELYCCGVELANGFGELTDADEQRRRLEAEMDTKESRYGERYPLDEDFLAAPARCRRRRLRARVRPARHACDRRYADRTGLWTPLNDV